MLPPSQTTLHAAAPNRPAPYPSAAAADNSRLPPLDALKRKPSAGILTTSTSASGKRTARITTTATACPAAAATANPPAKTTANTPHLPRHPLRLRDQNATSASRAVKSGPDRPDPKTLPSLAPRMPSYERPSTAGHGPRQPTIARAVNKPPLTPKIAARTPAAHHQTPTLATRRPLSSESTLSANGTASRDRDDLTSPVSAFLSTNITPRSGSRQSRVDSANSTPTGTPNPDRHDPWETRSGLGAAESDDAHKRPVVTLSPASEVGSAAKTDRDSKFFYASDAQKPPSQLATSRPTSLQRSKPSTFFYAKGNPLPDRQAAPPAAFSPPLASPSSQDSLMSKFMYANGTPELQPPAKIGPSPQTSSGSVVSTASRVPTARQGNIPRAASPVKPPQQVAPRNGSATIISPRSPVSPITPQVITQSSQAKVNVESHSRPKPHSRTPSVTFVEPHITTKRVSVHSSLPSSGSTSPSNPPNPGLTLPSNPATAGFASLLQAAEDFADSEEAQSESLNSPTKTSHDGQATELVANARRERKVQDLEITNASLEAINRTLERQLRKQTAELRRYQRLSRSGRLSLGSMGSRIPSDSSTVDGGGLARAGMGLDDLSEEESEIAAEDAELEEELDEMDEEDDMSGSEASGETSPGATGLRRDKRRADARRLQLDLSKHQQLLIDSQKINQSLKRCLGWTEELIKDGKRALAYQVRPSDVELGGRVLAPEEVERRQLDGIENEDITLGEDTIYAIDALGGGSLADTDNSATTFSKNPQDRDSGIELPAGGG